MPSQQLKRLTERLLRAGVARRHVQRYIRELHDHYEDAFRAELAAGLDRSSAEEAAWTRLGNEDTLAASVLDQRGLRSIAARFPGLAFAAAPTLSWLALLVLLGVIIFVEPHSSARSGPNVLELAYTLFLFYMRVSPVLLGILLLAASARQRMAIHWPIIGTALVTVLGGTTGVFLTLGATARASSFALSNSLLPMILPFPALFGPPNALLLARGLLRAALLLGIALTPYMVWRLREGRPSATG